MKPIYLYALLVSGYLLYNIYNPIDEKKNRQSLYTDCSFKTSIKFLKLSKKHSEQFGDVLCTISPELSAIPCKKENIPLMIDAMHKAYTLLCVEDKLKQFEEKGK